MMINAKDTHPRKVLPTLTEVERSAVDVLLNHSDLGHDNALIALLAGINRDRLAAAFKALPSFGVEDLRLQRQVEEKSMLTPRPEQDVVLHDGIALDTETTGKDPAQEDIIELALIGFKYDDYGNIYDVKTLYEGMEETSKELTEEVRRITKLTPEMLKGKRFNDPEINALLDGAEILVAHNAAYDRVLMERRFPITENKPWLCSLNDIDWDSEEVSSKGLAALLNHYGYFYTGHRARIDTVALVELMNQEMASADNKVLSSMLERLNLPNYHVYTYYADFGKKDLLKARSYQWFGGDRLRKKCWNKDIGTSALELDEEVSFLRETIYPNSHKDSFAVELRDSLVRYSARSGEPLSIDPSDEQKKAQVNKKKALLARKKSGKPIFSTKTFEL